MSGDNGEIRDSEGNVVGAFSGDREWAEKTIARWAALGIVKHDGIHATKKPALRVVGGSDAPNAPEADEP